MFTPHNWPVAALIFSLISIFHPVPTHGTGVPVGTGFSHPDLKLVADGEIESNRRFLFFGLLCSEIFYTTR